MGSGIVASGNLCQVGWEDTADDVELQSPRDAGPVCPAVNPFELTAFFFLGRTTASEPVLQLQLKHISTNICSLIFPFPMIARSPCQNGTISFVPIIRKLIMLPILFDFKPKGYQFLF